MKRNSITSFYRTPFLLAFLIGLAFFRAGLNDAGAQSEERGRLADGRAFRTDAEGNQLVDYIAELELSVESLERRVQGLESETTEKQQLIERLQRSAAAVPDLKERPVTMSAASTQVHADTCDKKIDHLSQLLDDKEIDLAVLKSESTHRVESLEETVSDLRAQLNVKSEQIVSLRSDLASASARAASLEEASLDSRAVNRVESDPPSPVVSQISPESSAPAPVYSREAVIDLSRSVQEPVVNERRSRAVASLQGRLQTDLNSLSSLIRTRDSMYARYRTAASGEPLEIESRVELDRAVEELRAEVNRATKVHELSSVRADISAVRGRVQREVALMRRVVR